MQAYKALQTYKVSEVLLQMLAHSFFCRMLGILKVVFFLLISLDQEYIH